MINQFREFNLFAEIISPSSNFLDSVYNACLYSDESASVKRTCDVFLSIFPNNNTLVNERPYLDDPDKTTRSKAKIAIKNEINSLLSFFRKAISSNTSKEDYDPDFGIPIDYEAIKSNEIIDKIEEINNTPRVVEAHFALSKGILPKKIDANNIHSVWILFDRHGQEQGKALGVFKECKSFVAYREVEVSQELSKINKLNVKQTLKQYFKFPQDILKYGVFQKYIDGEMIKHLKPSDSDPDAVDQIQFIGIFDLINRNWDRNNANIMIDRKGKVWAIDHEYVGGDKEAYEADRLYMISHSAANLPFSQNLKDHINALDINQHVIRSTRDSNNRFHVENMIGFLKWAISEHRKIPLTLAQIYFVLKLARVIPAPNDENYHYMLERGFKRGLPHRGEWYGLLKDVFPEIDELILKSFYNDVKDSLDCDLILEKHSRLKDYDKVFNEIYLDKLLAKQDEIDCSKVFTTQYLNKPLDKSTLSYLIKRVAVGTKYYDRENKSFTKDLKEFLDRLPLLILMSTQRNVMKSNN